MEIDLLESLQALSLWGFESHRLAAQGWIPLQLLHFHDNSPFFPVYQEGSQNYANLTTTWETTVDNLSFKHSGGELHHTGLFKQMWMYSGLFVAQVFIQIYPQQKQNSSSYLP